MNELAYIGAKVPRDLAAAVRTCAEREDFTVSATIRVALAAHLKSESAPAQGAPATTRARAARDMPKSNPVAGVSASWPTPLLYAAEHGHAGGNARAAGRCTECGLNYPLTGTACHPCQTLGYNQDQDQVLPSSPPGPGCNADAPRPRPGCNDDGPELHRLEEAHRRGQLQPLHVPLGEMPAYAGQVMRAMGDHIRLLIGLRRAAGDYRPLPYALSEAVRAGVAKDKPTASRARASLVDGKVIAHVGQLPPLRPGLDGTKLYAPPTEPKEPA